MLNIHDYYTSGTIWNGIASFMRNHMELYRDTLTESASDDDILKALKKNAREVLSPKEYDTFRKAVTSLRKGTAQSLKRENLYRLCYVLKLRNDTQAQNLFLNYLHQNELSARSLDEFILIVSLKIGLSWEETGRIRQTCDMQIASQPISPDVLEEGLTAEMYYTIINEKLHTEEDLLRFLEDPENLKFFSRTRNTQYLALFDDVELEVLYNGNQEQLIKLVTNHGISEKETMLEYYHSLFGLLSDDSEESLSDEEISSLCSIFENVFMTYDNFCLLVQRKRPIDISSGTFMLSLLKKLLTEEINADDDFFVNFLDPEEFTDICNDILIYFGFPVLNPVCDNFDRLLMDVYRETLTENSHVSNAQFQNLYLGNLRKYLKLMAARSISDS